MASDSAVKLALGAIGVAASFESNGECGIEPDCLVVIRDGAVELALGC